MIQSTFVILAHKLSSEIHTENTNIRGSTDCKGMAFQLNCIEKLDYPTQYHYTFYGSSWEKKTNTENISGIRPETSCLLVSNLDCPSPLSLSTVPPKTDKNDRNILYCDSFSTNGFVLLQHRHQEIKTFEEKLYLCISYILMTHFRIAFTVSYYKHMFILNTFIWKTLWMCFIYFHDTLQNSIYCILLQTYVYLKYLY